MKRVNYLLQLALAIVCVFGHTQEPDVQYTSEKITGTSESYVFTSEKSSTTETAHSAATSSYVASDQAGSTAGSLSVSMTGTANFFYNSKKLQPNNEGFFDIDDFDLIELWGIDYVATELIVINGEVMFYLTPFFFETDFFN